MDLEAMAGALEVGPDYRVLRRFVPKTRFHDMPTNCLKCGIVLAFHPSVEIGGMGCQAIKSTLRSCQ